MDASSSAAAAALKEANVREINLTDAQTVLLKKILEEREPASSAEEVEIERLKREVTQAPYKSNPWARPRYSWEKRPRY